MVTCMHGSTVYSMHHVNIYIYIYKTLYAYMHNTWYMYHVYISTHGTCMCTTLHVIHVCVHTPPDTIIHTPPHTTHTQHTPPHTPHTPHAPRTPPHHTAPTIHTPSPGTIHTKHNCVLSETLTPPCYPQVPECGQRPSAYRKSPWGTSVHHSALPGC